MLNSNDVRPGHYVLYWMQASQREEYNHALEYAISHANKLGEPVLTYFGLTRYPSANERSYLFMLEGLQEVSTRLEERGISFHVQLEEPSIGVQRLSKEASLIIVDADYQRLQKEWRISVARVIDCPLIQVESNVVVPIEVASGKEEYSAATLRPKIKKQLDNYLRPMRRIHLKKHSPEFKFESIDISNPQRVLRDLDVDRSAPHASQFTGGTTHAKKRLKEFIKDRLEDFAELRNDPTKNCLSNLSPYLHFGQISPIYVTLQAQKRPAAGLDSFLEELIVRRELSMNFVNYNPHYDSITCLPNWAQTTLNDHVDDKRQYLYSLEELEHAETHDPYWNAAQREMVQRGKMHGYMRMYWGKKIIEWSETPERAYKTAIYLNDKYELDGRDPNGYAGIAWCFGKHDRAWGERPIFGKVRYMSAKGLERKFAIEQYVKNNS